MADAKSTWSKGYSNYCINSGMNIFGIGLGIYPKGIEKSFTQIFIQPILKLYYKELLHCLMIILLI